MIYVLNYSFPPSYCLMPHFVAFGVPPIFLKYLISAADPGSHAV